MGGARERPATAGGKKMNDKIVRILGAVALWLAGIGLALAQSNAIEGFDVSEQAGKVVIKITTKEPLRTVPPNFAVASPARIAFDFQNTANALGRSNQDIGQGDLRSMNVVQGAERTRLVLNLRRPVVHEARVDGRNVVVTLSEPVVAQVLPGGQDRKSTRLNSSHLGISYAVFCLKKKKKTDINTT